MSGSPLPRVLGLLGLEKDPAVDDALREALPHLSPEPREAALKMICQRGQARVMHAVLVASPTYDASLRDAIFRRLDDFQAGLRSALQSETLADRSAAIVVIVAARDFKSLPLLTDALRSHCPRTRELAGNAIKAMTHIHLLDRNGLRARRLGEVLSAMLATWEAHHHPGALEAALWMIEQTEPALADALHRASARITPALKTLLDHPADPRLAPFALRALGHPELRAHAIRALSQARDETFIGALLDEMWLFDDPQCARTLHGIREWDGLQQKMVELGRTTPTRMAAAVRAVTECGVAEGAAATKLAVLGDQPGESLQRAALWQLVGDESNAATQALQVLASRTSDTRSAVALREVARRERRNPASHRAQAGGGIDPLHKALNRFVDEHEHLTAEERSVISRQLATFGPELMKALERKLHSPLAYERVATIHALRALNAEQALSSKLYACCHDPDSMVRLAALRALDGDAGATATRLLRDALNDPEPRVQAAAIELLEKRGIERTTRPVGDKLRSPHNRVRANAIKALWTTQAREAAVALERMLKEPSAPHRISALWVVERLRIREILTTLVDMERNDPDESVRVRARRVLRGLTLQDSSTVRHDARHVSGRP